MVKRFIVTQIASSSGGGKSSAFSIIHRGGVLAVALSAVAVGLVIQGYHSVDENNTLGWMIPVVAAFLMVLLLSIVGSAESREVSVDVYPLGIQLTTRVGQKRRQKGRPLFLPRSDILDCIVTEVIMWNRVQSAVVFRIKSYTTPESFQLVEAFPQVELTYEECLTMRRNINKYL